MKQVVLREGKVAVAEVPAPAPSPHRALVATAASVISSGTEAAALGAARSGLLEKAAAHPAPWRRLVEVAREEGVRGLWRRMAPAAGSDLVEMGYSAAGIILQAGEGITLPAGSRVACAGAQFAHHAELISVPEHLMAKIPAGVSFEQAAFGTIGSIALHGFRRSEAGLGETVAVVGLGLVGLLGAQIARAAGCEVIAFDPDPERVALARSLGIQEARTPEEADPVMQVLHRTGGQGADAALIFAATPSDEPLALAMRLCRKRGRVVVVGDVGMKAERSLMYAKELDLRISTSYGPGRYDPGYEEKGRDYPYAYVRWTEGRNLAAFLDLLAAGSVRVEPLIERIVPVEQAEEAYLLLREGGRKPAVLLSFPRAPEPERGARSVRLLSSRAPGSARRAVVIGPGTFMKEVFLPAFLSQQVAAIETVVAGTGAGARSAAERFSARIASTDLDEALADPSVDLAIIGTRHHLHGSQVERCLRSGKSVFVEKPLCLTFEELERIRAAREQGGVLAVGFNRRYAPLARKMKEALALLPGPRIVQIRVNAGWLEKEHWTQDPEQGGGRLVGEGCHFFDLIPFLAGSPIEAVRIEGIADSRLQVPDNFLVLLRLADGSLGSLSYTSQGGAELGKERVEVHCAGTSLVLEDFRELAIHGPGRTRRIGARQDKGITGEIQALKAALEGKPSELISWAEIEAATTWTLRAQALLEHKE
ncbi:MAG TPA: Gfo/Idh/MocA family oxidoreductase [Candidatus Polarisedimenticolia bacterium]|nr:Gfo/Idh/MocA family oxidoreductase [Candidatus Polarisedimenticolia bacterium]